MQLQPFTRRLIFFNLQYMYNRMYKSHNKICYPPKDDSLLHTVTIVGTTTGVIEVNMSIFLFVVW